MTRLATLTAAGALLALLAGVIGCEVNSYLDPSTAGRWQRTPIILPILTHLDVIDEPESDPPGLRQILPEDLIPEDEEYAIGAGDLVTISIFELMAPNVETVQTRRVDEVGQIRLPVLGRVEVAGHTSSEMEDRLAKMLEERGILKDPTVSVIVQENRRKTFSVLGAGRGVGIYQILRNDFRMMDALALSGTITSARNIYLIREVRIAAVPESSAAPAPAPETPPTDRPRTPTDSLIEQLLEGLDTGVAPREDESRVVPRGVEPPGVLESGLDTARTAPRWVNVEGKWKRVDGPIQLEGAAPDAGDPTIRQVVIEVPYQRLLEGDMSYNIVIRPGDIIRLPAQISGTMYLGGAVARPGSYAVPGERELTLRQLIFSAGGFSGVAHPDRVDLIRRMDANQEAIIRLNLNGIFEGTQPDFYLKPTDTINVGTSVVAQLLAIGRNGLRISYGFGFVFDRNFSDQETFR